MIEPEEEREIVYDGITRVSNYDPEYDEEE
jgi:hypothetical protein